MFDDIWLPIAPASDKKALRDFSRAFSFIICLFFLAIIPWWFNTAIPYWPLYTSALLLLAGQFAPVSIYPVYRTWMVIASILAWVNTRLILFFAFYLMILPIGLLLRAFKKLQYKRYKWPDKNGGASYWVKREKSPQAENLKEPF